MNSNVDADGGFDLRHRALGALVLVVVGVVVLPMILNGASMAPEVVAIDSGDGTKVPRTFETNIRPLNSQDSAVRVESESRDRLKAELSFPESEKEIAAPAVEPENAPLPVTDEVPAKPTSQLVVADDSSTTSNDDTKLEPAESSAAIDKFEVNEAGDVNEIDGTGETGASEHENTAERLAVADQVGSQEGTETAVAETAVESEASDTNGAGTDSSDSVIEPLPEIVPGTVPDVVEKTEVAKIDKENSRNETATDTSKAVDEAESAVAKEGADQESQQPPKATGTAGWVVRIGTFGEADNAARMVTMLNEKGIPGQSSVSKTKSGRTLTRVWIGPFDNREIASRELTKIEKATGEKGFVTAYP